MVDLNARLKKIEEQFHIDREPFTPALVIVDDEPDYKEKVTAAHKEGQPVVIVNIVCGRSCPDDRHCLGQHGCRHKEATP